VAEPLVVEVKLWGKRAGAVAPLTGRPGYYEFQYAEDFSRSGLQPSPLQMPLDARRRYSFPALDRDSYFGLPGMLSDALPDRFGNMLIDEHMARQGIKPQDVTSLQRLLYTGRRGMGSLEFEPAMRAATSTQAKTPLAMALLVEDARRALRGNTKKLRQDIIDVGSSAGGARAKAVLGWNRATNELVSGQFDLPDGFEHWLLKFDVGDNKQLGTTGGFGRIEYAHYVLAIEAGIDMSECHLLEENGRAHFMTKRFDRVGNDKLHAQSLCAMAHLDFNTPFVHGYEQLLRTILKLGLGAEAIEQAWIRCAFNVAFVNCDDHTKNFGFLMDAGGRWRLAPAYDICFSHNPGAGRWTRQHQMLVRGKAWDITAEDLIELGREFGVNQPREKLDKVLSARGDWPRVALKAGVPATRIKEIQGMYPKLVARISRPKATPTAPAKKGRKAKDRRGQ
jgi:serine/threonine-protein kinase HipA